jgi:RNA polymerase sigma-70 factor (ECF subfamily)
VNETAEVVEFVRLLQTTDLYLSVACAQGSDAAWRRFQTIYQRRIYETALFLCQQRSAADELANSLMGHLFIKDSSGGHRIASYDGQVALTTWLWAVMAHKALDERDRKCHQVEQLESLPDIADPKSQGKLEIVLRASRYSTKILAACKGAVIVLTPQERLFLLLHYQEALHLAEIAEMYRMSKSNVSYHLKQARQKLGQRIMAILREQYGLNETALEECKEELLETPTYSLLTLLQVD